jgi:four helix bundle protein
VRRWWPNLAANFLNVSRRSVFEVANMLLVLSQNGFLELAKIQPLLDELEEQSRMTLAFIRPLK